ncbi:hypothetical protein ACFL43_02810 [Thermodesulfobacteriota bacterium]
MPQTYRLSSKPEICPACGSPRVARIIYDLPTLSEESLAAVREGRVVYRSCDEAPDAPLWQCTECGLEVYLD